MLTTLLLETLLKIERSLGHAQDRGCLDHGVREMLMEAQAQLLAIEKDRIALLEELQRLRESRTPPGAPPLGWVCPSCRSRYPASQG